VSWAAAAAYALQTNIELRYALMHQDTSFQQTAAGASFICWLVATLIVALAADRCFELLERVLLEKAARAAVLK
jgi:hypothetical protein